MKSNRVFTAIAIGLLLGLNGMGAAFAQQAKTSRTARNGGDGEISINFDNAPVLEVVDVMSRVTGQNFIIDPSVKGSVTVIAPKGVPKAEAFGVFESILELNGFSLVPMGNVIKVVPSRSATQRNIPVGKGRESEEVHERDQIITQLIPIKYADAQALTSVLTPLVSRDANLTTYTNTNTIILTEMSSNIKRLLEIVEEVDVPGFEETITIIPLVNAQADVLAPEILQALEPGPSAAPSAPRPRTGRRATPAQPLMTGTATSQIKIIPDLRTNSLIVVANELDTEQVRFLVGELDVETPVEANNIHVHALKNALAEDIAAVLTSLATTTTAPGAAGGGATAAAVSGIRTFYREVSIVADKTTNSLIITATPQDYGVLKKVINQLDIMRPQVLVETLIAEVSLDFSRDLGVQWLAANPHGKDHGYAGVNEGGGGLAGSVAAAIASDGSTVVVPTPPAGMSVGYFNMDADFIKAFIEINASETNDDISILSAPHVLTLDNEKAVINISDSVPFITQRLQDTGGTTDLSTNETFEYRDVGIILEITPHISPERMVRLEILQKVNDVSQVESGTSSGALAEKKREAETTVMVKDGNTLVLGGLMKDFDDITINKVPFLGDIPFLGWAFKSESKERRKTNLLLFITPRIVASPLEANALTVDKVQGSGGSLRKQLEDYPSIKRSRTFEGKTGDSDIQFEEAGPK